ncbi:MAG: glycoside hydrolase family 76 protein, partial [Pseudomonadota bacterium]
WLVPHFEKMLYDNAQLLALLADAAADTRNPLFAARAAETVGWLEREMLVEGAFASSLDADSEGEEGKFYVWKAEEIDQVLGPDAAAFRLAYGVTDSGNWEGNTVLNRLHQQVLLEPKQEAKLRESADRLLLARAKRIRPELDDKVLADWNGLMIAALAKASAVFDQPDWLARAEAAFGFVVERMSRNGRLVHSWREGRSMDLAFLEDYAEMAHAAVILAAHTNEQTYLDRARGWIDVLDQDYLDMENGGYFQAPATSQDLLVRPKNAQDGPLPNGNGLLVTVLATLFYLTGDVSYRQRAERQIIAFSGDAARNPLSHASLLSGAMLLAHPVQVVLIGDEGADDLGALRRIALAAPVPEIVVTSMAPGAVLPRDHPAFGKGQIDARATAYVCPGQTCRQPVTTAMELAESLANASVR